MDKASVFGTEDCRFESYRGQFFPPSGREKSLWKSLLHSIVDLSAASQISRAVIAQLGERQTEDLEVPGSIPGHGTFSFVEWNPRFGRFVPRKTAHGTGLSLIY